VKVAAPEAAGSKDTAAKIPFVDLIALAKPSREEYRAAVAK
jgi:hypothetical protein